MRSYLLVGGLLLALRVGAQQPALPGAPTLPAPSNAPAVSELAPSPPPETGELPGRAYGVELRSGTAFTGVLVATDAATLTFDTRDLGRLVVNRSNLRQLSLLTQQQARLGYDDVGNGNRLLFGPTARNLRRGEGYVQNAYIFLVSANYGVTDNFSIGTLFSFVPAAGTDNFFSITPKLSVPVGPNLRVGAGAVLGIAGGSTFGITYANGTYGSADNNLTLGVGYGFADGAFSSTPVFVLGGATRVSRRVSLMNKTYFFRTADSFSQENYALGIAGVRIAAQRLSGGLGIAYSLYYRTYANGQSDSDGGAIPYAEISFRFGRPR